MVRETFRDWRKVKFAGDEILPHDNLYRYALGVVEEAERRGQTDLVCNHPEEALPFFEELEADGTLRRLLDFTGRWEDVRAKLARSGQTLAEIGLLSWAMAAAIVLNYKQANENVIEGCASRVTRLSDLRR
jgi:hypothetical protein